MRLPRCAGMLVCLLGVMSAAVAADKVPDVFTSRDAAAEDPDFALQGEYTGQGVGVQVVSQGEGRFLAVIYRGGLPGAGWNGTERQESDEDRETLPSLIENLGLKKIERRSPTLGAQPPAGARALFQGRDSDLKEYWQSGAKVDGDLLQQGCMSLEKFDDFVLHLEFQLPYMPTARGQGRGNSGLYFQGRYEVQILDSFGLEGKDNECGGLYTIKSPDLNMCLPPLVWQTYDVEFTAARWKDGKKLSNARVTVRHNGTVVQQDVELPHTTTAAPLPELAEAGPIYLQDHGNPVRYRNIWVLPRDVAQDARRPIIPAFERFHVGTGRDPALGGQLLLGELNCVACHQPTDAQRQRLSARPAPDLTDVGQRVQPDYLIQFLSAPHATKPGTLMPDLLGTMPEPQRSDVALALVNFLVGGASVPEMASDIQAIQRGEKLYREIGCLACHAARETDASALATSVPLGDLKQKYTVASLAQFLKEPHRARPAGRMPRLIQEDREAVDLASYLIGEVEYRPRNPNLKFAAYHGNWNNVPDFDKVKPVRRGESAGFNLSLASRGNDFGMRFEGFLKIERDGTYQFHLGSDDGSILFIDGKKVVDSDGVHPHTVQSGRTRLKQGMHPLRVDYTQGGGEASLTLEFEGPGTPRQDIQKSVFLTAEGPPPASPDEEVAGFRYDEKLASSGRQHFVTLGCVHCHQLPGKGLEPVMSRAPALGDLRPGQGCLAADAVSGNASQGPSQTASGQPVPVFDLNYHQRDALNAALNATAKTALQTPVVTTDSPDQKIASTMEVFNCYACHSRQGAGGPEPARNALFKTAIPEMGDEGRVPPPLDGVGDKLNDRWIRHVLENGTKDRPYMLTRMPQFGVGPVMELVAEFVTADRRTESKPVELVEALHRVKATGRQLVGDKALGCIKCHTFGQHRATGIQAINLQSMTQRIREDWFLRYMVDPPAYRPGTRMPTGFPDGKATIRDVYNGNTEQQLAAIWTYLKDGTKAGIPDGLLGKVIELKPTERPIVYRNFIEGLSPRGIAVGYPEQANLAWDANRMSLSLIWHGRFIDAGKHWEGRGAGTQGPLGDHVLKLEETLPLAVLENREADWPQEAPRERGFRFRSYQLDPQGRPHFHYTGPDFAVEDFPEPVKLGQDASIRRKLRITSTTDGVQNLYFRAAVGRKIERQSDGLYVIDEILKITLTGQQPILREVRGQQELLVPLMFEKGQAEVIQELSW